MNDFSKSNFLSHLNGHGKGAGDWICAILARITKIKWVGVGHRRRIVVVFRWRENEVCTELAILQPKSNV